MLEHVKNMGQNNENWKFVGSSQQLPRYIGGMIRDHQYIKLRAIRRVFN